MKVATRGMYICIHVKLKPRTYAVSDFEPQSTGPRFEHGTATTPLAATFLFSEHYIRSLHMSCCWLYYEMSIGYYIFLPVLLTFIAPV